MIQFKKWTASLCPRFSAAISNLGEWTIYFLIFMFSIVLAILIFYSLPSYASVTLPGDDGADKLKAAGIILRFLDTALFSWGARLFAGLCIMSSAWALKEQRFGTAIICIVGAIIFGTAPKWVANIFEVGGSDSVFSGSRSSLTPQEVNDHEDHPYA